MIITIARQCGSGGHEIGRELASRLGMELYDRKKLEEEARKLGKYDENKEFFQEKAVNSLLYSIAVSYETATRWRDPLSLCVNSQKENQQ